MQRPLRKKVCDINLPESKQTKLSLSATWGHPLPVRPNQSCFKYQREVPSPALPEDVLRRFLTGLLLVLIYVYQWTCNYISTVFWSHQDQHLGQAGQPMWQKLHSFVVVLPLVVLQFCNLDSVLKGCLNTPHFETLIVTLIRATVMWVIQTEKLETLMQSVNNHATANTFYFH